ncbi:serine/threonine-protein kinase [Sporobolomyces koalae]|uniref:serine/threonine-protein kinase n=1 Tax=Sporobolomyces koalae TaxID=500713 RepID=UPI00317A0FC8
MSFAVSPRLDALDPRFVARYDILEEIGVGGTGSVYKVRRRSDGGTFAAKVMSKARVGPRALVKTLHWGLDTAGLTKTTKDGAVIVPTEAYVLRRLKHPGVVGFVDLLACETYFYLVMEFHGASWQAAADQSGPVLPPSPPVTPPSRQLDFPSLLPSPLEATSGSFSLPAPTEMTNSARVSLPSTISPPSPCLVPTLPDPKVALLRAPLMRRSSSDLFEAIEHVRCFNEPAARYVFHQIVATVLDLASVGIRHSDLKDENIVLDERLHVKLVDFGSCRMWDVTKPAPPQTGRFYGTGTFAAPEIFQNAPYDGGMAEIWSLGVILSLLLTGAHPFASSQDARIGFLAPLRHPVSPLAFDCLRRCLTVDVSRRIKLQDLIRHPWILERARTR